MLRSVVDATAETLKASRPAPEFQYGVELLRLACTAESLVFANEVSTAATGLLFASGDNIERQAGIVALATGLGVNLDEMVARAMAARSLFVSVLPTPVEIA